MGVLRDVANTYFEVSGDNFGTVADDVLLTMAILVGQLEGRTLTAGKLATFAGIPRPTVIRKLQRLEERGLVVRLANGTFKVSAARLNSPEGLRAHMQLRALVKATAAQLSKLDSKPIAALIVALVW